MKDWYLRQSPRDRMIVIGLGILVILGMAYALLWYPMQTRHASAEQAIISKGETLEFIEQGAARIRAVGGVNGGSSSSQRQSSKETFLLVDELIGKADMSKPDRLEPNGSSGARIQFSEVQFDKLIVLLSELELYGLKVETLNISRKDAPGLVSARINMERG